jgi:hypothetical protein
MFSESANNVTKTTLWIVNNGHNSCMRTDLTENNSRQNITLMNGVDAGPKAFLPISA